MINYIWTCMHQVMINCNPETVSTDFDESHRLYFEELSFERVLDVYEMEGCTGAVVSFGGQTPQNLALPLKKAGVKVLGTDPEMIDNAEDRNRHSAMLDELGIDQPAWSNLTGLDEAKAFCNKVLIDAQWLSCLPYLLRIMRERVPAGLAQHVVQ